MSEAKHTRGPWSTDERYVRQAGSGKPIAGTYPQRHGGPYPDADRIVACVNACEGINPEAVPELLVSLQALGVMPEGYCFCFGNNRDALKPDAEHTGECLDARAAIAKAACHGAAEGEAGKTGRTEP